jgi:molybdopterin-guanine dinucleotide biosynthesis protein A
MNQSTLRPADNVGGIVLCGGQSTRMGLPKATLPFGTESMLTRVVRILSSVVKPIVVVAAPNQQLPDLPPTVVLARDQREARGPLEGIRAGLSALPRPATSAYVTSCDVPLLVPAFVSQLLALMQQYEVVVPHDGDLHHPLAAVYDVRVVDRIESLLESNRFRPVFLFDVARTLRVPVEVLRGVDPELKSLRNLNHPDDYVAALRDAGLEAPDDVLAGLRRPQTR